MDVVVPQHVCAGLREGPEGRRATNLTGVDFTVGAPVLKANVEVQALLFASGRTGPGRLGVAFRDGGGAGVPARAGVTPWGRPMPGATPPQSDRDRRLREQARREEGWEPEPDLRFEDTAEGEPEPDLRFEDTAEGKMQARLAEIKRLQAADLAVAQKRMARDYAKYHPPGFNALGQPCPHFRFPSPVRLGGDGASEEDEEAATTPPLRERLMAMRSAARAAATAGDAEAEERAPGTPQPPTPDLRTRLLAKMQRQTGAAPVSKFV